MAATIEAMQRDLHRATGHFFDDKFKDLDRLSPESRCGGPERGVSR